MFTILFATWANNAKVTVEDEPSHIWYGACAALLGDVFLISLLVYWLRSLTNG